jgi:hypothetical protein
VKAEPSSIFRYRPISVNSIYEVSTSSFYLAEPSSFNDPFDCDFLWKSNSEEDKIDHLDFCQNGANLEELQTASDAFEKQIRTDVNELGITCFTADPLNPLMWAHYADGHRGICIEYKREGVLNSDSFAKVKYEREQKLVWNSLDIGKDMSKLGDFLDSVVFQKLPEWSYEKEWRLMLIRPTSRVVYMSEPVLSVTFGLKCTDSEASKFMNIFRIQHRTKLINFYWVQRDEEGKLKRVELTFPEHE